MSEPTPETGTPPETGEPEPDTGDDGDEEAADAEASPPAEEPPPPVDMEKALRDLASENRRHATRVETIMGEDFQAYEFCPVCDGFGFAVAGTQAPPELKDDATTEMCGRCDGIGATRTGSRNPEFAQHMCVDCNGTGYVTKMQHSNVAPITQTSEVPPEVAALRARGYTVLDPYTPATAGQ